jgi:hypothetical protein
MKKIRTKTKHNKKTKLNKIKQKGTLGKGRGAPIRSERGDRRKPCEKKGDNPSKPSSHLVRISA